MSMSAYQTVVELMTIYQNQYTQVDKLWTYFSVVSITVAGFVISNDKATKTLREAIAVVIAYGVFCIGNSIALVKGQTLLHDLSVTASNAAMKAKVVTTVFTAVTPNQVFWFQLLVSGSVCIGILAIAWLRQKKV
jgi:hypothetical protein